MKNCQLHNLKILLRQTIKWTKKSQRMKVETRLKYFTAYFDYFHCVHTFFVKFQIKYVFKILHTSITCNIQVPILYLIFIKIYQVVFFWETFFHFHLQKNLSFMKWNLPSPFPGSENTFLRMIQNCL